MSQPEQSARPRYSAAGTAALMIIGLLILVPSGLCTGIFGGGAVLDAIVHPENIGDSVSMIGAALVFGGPFVAVGGVLVWLGVKRMRGR
jgi:hypothetical protein